MKIWIETNDLPLIEKGVHAGLLHGVVTTSSYLIQNGNPKELLLNLLNIQPGPVIVDLYSDYEEKGRRLAELSPRIVLRIPAIEGAWQAIYTLSKNATNVMAGAIFSPVHALLAARAGAAFVSPHLSRMLKAGDRPLEQIESVHKMITNYNL